MLDTAHGTDIPKFDFNEIDEHVRIGTNACCETHFAESLIAAGVDADISMEGEQLDRPYGVSTFLWLPTEDHTAPSRQNVEVGIDALDRLIRQGRKVYIHCKNGHGRAPTFYAAFLIMKRHMRVEDAVTHIREKRPSIHIEDPQMALLKELSAGQ